MSDDLRDRIAEVLTGHPIGNGYYGTGFEILVRRPAVGEDESDE